MFIVNRNKYNAMNPLENTEIDRTMMRMIQSSRGQYGYYH